MRMIKDLSEDLESVSGLGIQQEERRKILPAQDSIIWVIVK